VPWSVLCALIEPFYPKPGNGRPQAGLDPRRGFALASMRKPMLSRYYIQCDLWLEK
jgi:hypothetical protein